MTYNPEVLPCDREAAAQALGYASWQAMMYPAPRDSSGVAFVKPGLKWRAERAAEIFARHRTAAEKGAGGEAIAWMARHKVTKDIYWDDECCVCCAKSGADEIASYLEDHESFPLYAHPPQPNAALVEALREAREALHFHYTEWDGEPEDAVPLQLARDRIDAILAGKG